MIELSESRKKWLGGVFEAGGSMYFNIKTLDRGKECIFSLPTISFSDNNYQKVSMFQQLVGGAIYAKSSSKSHELRITREIAVEIACRMEQYSPRRKDAISAFKLWKEADDKPEKFQIANDFRAKTPEYPPPNAYVDLVKMPEFVGGIIDSRGLTYPHFDIYPGGETDHAYYELTINTSNRPLLEALQREYGGRIHVQLRTGQTKKVGGRPFTVAKDTFRLVIGSSKSRPFLESIRSCLLTGEVNGQL